MLEEVLGMQVWAINHKSEVRSDLRGYSDLASYLVLLRHELLDGRVRGLDEAGVVGRGRPLSAVERRAAVAHRLVRRDELAVVAAHCGGGGDASCPRSRFCDRLFRKTMTGSPGTIA